MAEIFIEKGDRKYMIRQPEDCAGEEAGNGDGDACKVAVLRKIIAVSDKVPNQIPYCQVCGRTCPMSRVLGS